MTKITQEDLITDLDAIARKPRAPRRRRTTGPTRACSDKQLSFAAVLVAEKCGGKPEDVDTSLWADMSVKEASATIDALKKGPKMTHENGTTFKTIPTGPPATEKQIAFVKKLIAEKGATDIDPDALTKSSASAAIDDLLKRPKVSGAPASTGSDFLKVADFPEIIASSYAVTGNDGTTDFYVVQHGRKGTRWEGTMFVKLHVAGREDVNVRGPIARTIAERIMSDGPREAAIRYGKELGECACCHRELTNNDSIEAGIGPVCARKAGW